MVLIQNCGKYHRTFCDNCKKNSEIKNGLCKNCKSKKIVKGVYDRVLEIKDREDIYDKKNEKTKEWEKLPKFVKEKIDKYIYQISLEYIPSIGNKTLNRLLEYFGNEMNILHKIPIDNIEMEFGEKIAKSIENIREGNISISSRWWW